MIKLGSKVKDSLTGFTGVAMGRSEYLYGCAKILIEPLEMKDGKLLESYWFDEQRVFVIEERGPVVSPDSSAVSGGPQSDPVVDRSRP